MKTGCPYCAKVRTYCAKHHIEFEERNIAEPKNHDLLLERGGKIQVPYLVDGEHALYESGDIIMYLAEKISDTETRASKPMLTIHGTNGTSPVCPS